jgi:hypothetical protein
MVLVVCCAQLNSHDPLMLRTIGEMPGFGRCISVPPAYFAQVRCLEVMTKHDTPPLTHAPLGYNIFVVLAKALRYFLVGNALAGEFLLCLCTCCESKSFVASSFGKFPLFP